MALRTVGIRGLTGLVYEVEGSSLIRDDAGAPTYAVKDATGGFYHVKVLADHLNEKATIEIRVYRSKAKFKNRTEQPYQTNTFSIKNHYEEGVSTFADFDTWFSDDVTKTSGNSETRSAIELIKTFTGSSAFEIRNGIMNTANYSTLTNATIQSGD